MRKPCKQQAFVKLQIRTTFRKTKNNDSGASKVGFFFLLLYIHDDFTKKKMKFLVNAREFRKNKRSHYWSRNVVTSAQHRNL